MGLTCIQGTLGGAAGTSGIVAGLCGWRKGTAKPRRAVLRAVPHDSVGKSAHMLQPFLQLHISLSRVYMYNCVVKNNAGSFEIHLAWTQITQETAKSLKPPM